MKDGRTTSSTRRPGARPRLFLSYRRRFDQASARLLKAALTKAFGEGAVFRDVDDIEPGAPFPQTIREAVENCDALLLLVSPGWLDIIAELQDPEDFVRREIVVALKLDVPLIPLLLGGARMPQADELPEEIRDLAFRQAIELSDDRWDYDVERLVKLIRARAALSEPPSMSGRIVAALRSLLATWPRRLAAAGLLAAAAFAVYLYNAEVIPPDNGKIRPTPVPTPTFEECLMRLRAPGTREATVTVQDKTPAEATPIVRVDEYKRLSPPPPEGVPILITLNEPWGGDGGVFRDFGAVLLRYLKGDYPKGNVAFKVEKVIESPCAEVTDYSNNDSKAKSEVYNWDGLSLRLRGRSYRLRLGDHGDSLLATLTLDEKR